MPKETALTVNPGLIDRVGEKVEPWIHSPHLHIRPRISLLTGSVFVLTTLSLPVAYVDCGPNKTGVEFVQGDGFWYSLVGFASSGGARGLYAFSLGLAALTLILALVWLLRPKLVQKKRLVTVLFLLASGNAFFVISDISGRQVLDAFDWLAGEKGIWWVPVGVLTLALFFTSCFVSAECWPKRDASAWLLAVPGTFSFAWLSYLVLDALSQFRPGPAWESLQNGLIWPACVSWFVYSLGPLALWIRFCFSHRADVRARWRGVRSGLIAFYGPAALIDLRYILGEFCRKKPGLWGLAPYFIGIHLIALGYTQLAREGETTRAGTPVPIPHPAIAGS
jgi:hypothetical protein